MRKRRGSVKSSKGEHAEEDNSVDIEGLLKEQAKEPKEQLDKSNLTAEFLEGEDDPDNDEMAQMISKKVDPFNINHKKN